MPDYTITLTDEQVEGIREMVIREMPDDCPTDPKGFIEWLIDHNVKTRKREKLMRKIEALDTEKLETLVNSVKDDELRV